MMDLQGLTELQALMRMGQPQQGNGQNFDPVAAMKKYWIDPQAELMEPPVVLSIDGVPAFTRGNFSLLIGRAKSRKSFLAASMAAAVLGRSSLNCIDGVEGIVLFFDTEQSEYHAQRSVKGIYRQASPIGTGRFQAYALRPLEPWQRLKFIEHCIKTTPDIALACIDGVVDLLSNGINDEAEAIKLTSWLLKMTAEHNMHIINVLHQNKGDFNARGHIGTSLVNKAETVISVAKDANDPTVSLAKADYSRGLDFKPFGFTIANDGTPVQADPVAASQGREQADTVKIFTEILPGMTALSYSDLTTEYMERTGAAERTAKRHIAEALRKSVIAKDRNKFYRMNFREIPDEPVPF